MSKEAKDSDAVKAKLSKKIAELSTVVQALFVRNHEKELELTATKQSYEEEMKRVVDEGKSRLNWLENQLDDLERFRTLLEMKTEECERTKGIVETLNEKQLQAEKKMNERGVLLSEALAEIVDLKKEMSRRSPEEVEQLKRENCELGNELEQERKNLHYQKELVKGLEHKVHIIEMNLNDMFDENETLKMECSRLRDELVNATDEVKNLSQCLQDAKRTGERALQRTRKLEEKNKTITTEKTLLTKCNEQLNEQVNKLLAEQQFRDKPTIASKKITTNAYPRKADITDLPKSKQRLQQPDDEVQNLKREIEKYRLELKNREVNFNRVFAEKNPLVIKKPMPEIATEELRLRNLTGLVGYKKTLTVLPSVVSEPKAAYRYHGNQTRR